MLVFANLNGKWTELTGDDYIENETAEIFVASTLSKNISKFSNSFLEISHNDFIYHVHVSQIQWANDRY